MKNTQHWRYRAFDANFQLREGICQGEPYKIILEYGQKGYQIVDLTSVSAAESRLLRKREKLTSKKCSAYASETIIHRVWRIVNYILGRS